VLNLGFLIQFISMPTITGFVTAGVLTIGSSQVKPLLGIKSGASGDFVESWKNVFIHLDEIRISDTCLGLLSLVLLFAMKKPFFRSRWPTFSKYLSISRNALVVIMGIIVAYLCQLNDKEPFRLTGTVAEGLPEFQLPPMHTELNGRAYNFVEMVESLGIWLLTLPLVSLLETIAIAKAFSKGKIVDVTQEIITLGLCNITSSFFRSIPISGAFSRTAINHNSGVKTPLGGVITGCIVLLALSVLTGIFFFIPKTTLAAVSA
jgi:sodium-independent sulfate anion transporter 11